MATGRAAARKPRKAAPPPPDILPPLPEADQYLMAVSEERWSRTPGPKLRYRCPRCRWTEWVISGPCAEGILRAALSRHLRDAHQLRDADRAVSAAGIVLDAIG